jgi:DNA-binding MarR family transcriptional regulator
VGQVGVQVESFIESEPEQLSYSDIEKLLDELEQLCSRLSSALLPPRDPNVDASAVRGGTFDAYKIDRVITNILRSRRMRNRLFGDNLFGEPAWDVLLELYAAELNGRKLSVSGACYASAAPPSTGLRWVHRLEKEGWIRRVADPADCRRSWVELTQEASARMRQLLNEFAGRLS